jgi:glycosyltransferase involved in cell wall biosynthesis
MYHNYYFDDIMASYVWQEPCDYEVLFMVTAKDSGVLACTMNRLKEQNQLPWRVFEMPGENNCKSRNIGAKEAKGDVLLFIDGDQILAPSLFRTHYAAHDFTSGLSGMLPKVGMGICNINIIRYENRMEAWTPHMPEQRMTFSGSRDIMPKTSLFSPDCLRFVRELKVSQAIGMAFWHNMDDFTDYVNVVGRNVSVNKRAFLDNGMWDEDLAYSESTQSRGWEDLALGLTMHKAGLGFVMVPSWTVHLEHPRMAKDGGIENIVKVARKHSWFLDERPDWWKLRYDRDDIRRKAFPR